MQSVDPIIEVQIDIKYPMIFADLDLFKNVWKKTAMPIWAKDQPKRTMMRIKGSV